MYDLNNCAVREGHWSASANNTFQDLHSSWDHTKAESKNYCFVIHSKYYYSYFSDTLTMTNGCFSIHLHLPFPGQIQNIKQGSKLKKSWGYLLATNQRNIVTRCKFLVASLFNVNDAAHSTGRSIRFDCLKISRKKVSLNLEVNWICLCNLAHFLWRKQSKVGWNVCFNFTL